MRKHRDVAILTGGEQIESPSQFDASDRKWRSSGAIPDTPPLDSQCFTIFMRGVDVDEPRLRCDAVDGQVLKSSQGA